MHGAKREMHTTGFWWGDLLERDHLEDLGVDEGMLLKWILKNSMGELGLDSSGLGYGKCRPFVNTVRNVTINKTRGISCLEEELLASYEEFSSIELHI
jgi:hypothetical protein